MSVKRSWDVRRNVVAEVAPAPSRRESLKARRQKARVRFGQIALVVLALLFAGLVFLLWQPMFRIQTVEVEGPHTVEVGTSALAALQGTYFYVLPRNSIFIYPEISLREQVLATFPDIVAVAVSRESFTSLRIKGVPRTSAFVWCGTTALTPEGCYEADAEGYVFAALQTPDAALASDTLTLAKQALPPSPIPDSGQLLIYAPLVEDVNEDGTPIRARVVGAERIPDALRFVKAMSQLNVAIVSVEIREDEADLYTPAGTRITYIMGTEEAAAALAASAFPSLDVSSGALSYVDLRFNGKVYIKRRGEVAPPDEVR